MKLHKTPSILFAVSLCTAAFTQAQINRTFNNDGGDNLWSNSANWSGSEIADTNSEFVQLNGSPIVDQDFTVNRVQSNFGSTGSNVSSGGGVLTIDAGSNQGLAISQVSNQSGSNLQFSGSVKINNSGTGLAISRIGFTNGADTAITFASGSTLDLTTRIETQTGLSRSINFDGSIIGGSAGVAGIRIGADSDNHIFGATADNTGYAGDMVLFANSGVISNSTVANGLLNSGAKIQVNGSGGSLTLNGAGAMGGNIVIGASNSLTLNANADQSNMGFLDLDNDSSLNISLGALISELAFGSSAAIDWGTGTVSITGFKENTIRFGTDASGLTSAQLAAIDGGIYNLTNQGFLSIPEPRAYGLIFGTLGLGLSMVRRRR